MNAVAWLQPFENTELNWFVAAVEMIFPPDNHGSVVEIILIDSSYLAVAVIVSEKNSSTHIVGPLCYCITSATNYQAQ